MTKSALRQQFLARRRALSAGDVTRRSRAIAERFFGEFLGRPVGMTSITLHTFLPIVRQKEVDTWPIIHRIWQEFANVQVVASVTDTTTNRLTHYALTPETPLTENRWGIPEPQPGRSTAVDSHQIDLVLVPLLAFDRQGHRVGYGKGYYDRFLAECRLDCPKIGLSLFEPVERIDDTEPTDVWLTTCITPEQIQLFDA